MVAAHDTPELRKARGAFFTPPAIADFLTDWALDGNAAARVFDPTCGESVFLLAAGRRLKGEGCSVRALAEQMWGTDLHQDSLDDSARLLSAEGLSATLLPATDFFAVASPDQPRSPMPFMDAVVGNPPFVRYQDHAGETRRLSAAAALRQGVRLNGLASSWAATVVHSSAFLKPEGRLAMVLPAELLTVHYAEPVRRWLRTRFKQVTLVVFERLQFEDALENVVLVLGQGTGGCDSFNLHYVHGADELADLRPEDPTNFVPNDEGKWSDLLLSTPQRDLFRRVSGEKFTGLSTYGAPELGTVTGANHFFMLSETTRKQYGLEPGRHVIKACPPGTRHLTEMSFTSAMWSRLKDAGEAVWMLWPADPDDDHAGLARYKDFGIEHGVPEGYKCSIRGDLWYRPPAVKPPSLFFTYMSHRYPRLVTNSAKVTFVNSMHGVRLAPDAPKGAASALPLLMLNSVTMLGAELHGRSYGGGILKMEPREAGRLPVPNADALAAAWKTLQPMKSSLARQVQKGLWVEASKTVDDVLLRKAVGLKAAEVAQLRASAHALRSHRLGQST